MQNNQQLTPNFDAQYRTMLIVWFAILGSIVMYFVLATVVPVEAESNRLLTIVLSAVSVFMTGASFAARKTFLSRSVELQQPKLVNTAYIAAAACCEAGGLIGLLDKFIAADRYYYLLIGIAFIGQVLNFPRRESLEAASVKKL